MRISTFIALAIVTAISVGCATRRPAPEVAGVFKNREGRHVLLEPDGHIYDSQGNAAGVGLHFVGIASPERKHPEKIFVITPSAASERWMGVTLVFSSDFKSFDVFGYPPETELTKAPKDRYERVY